MFYLSYLSENSSILTLLINSKLIFCEAFYSPSCSSYISLIAIQSLQMNDLFLLLLGIYYFYIIHTKNIGHLANYKVIQNFQAFIYSFFNNLNHFFEI